MINAKPDLSGLGNQKMDTPTAANTLRIGPSSNTVRTQEQIDAAFVAQQRAAQAATRPRPSSGRPDARRGRT